jgi:hypothetical protein
MSEMIHNVAPALLELLVPVETLTHLVNNPRTGATDAIAESYKEFMQLTSIICSLEDDGSIVVLAGNHQLMAARDILGWTHIAAAAHSHLSEAQKKAFAALDNHWGSMGSIDEKLQWEMLEAAGNVAPELFELVNWDDFALAAMEDSVIMHAIEDEGVEEVNTGWIAPVIIEAPLIDPDATPEEAAVSFTPQTGDDSIVTQGSPVTSKSGSTSAKIQYTMVFDDSDHQGTWYQFLRFLKEDPTYRVLGTTSAQVTAFIRDHTEVD